MKISSSRRENEDIRHNGKKQRDIQGRTTSELSGRGWMLIKAWFGVSARDWLIRLTIGEVSRLLHVTIA